MNGGNKALLCSCWRENVGTIKPWKRDRAVFLHCFGHDNFYTVCFIHSEWVKCYFTSDIFSFLLWSFGYMQAWFWGWYFLCIENTGVCLLASMTSLYLLGAKLKKILKTQQLLFGHSVVSRPHGLQHASVLIFCNNPWWSLCPEALKVCRSEPGHFDLTLYLCLSSKTKGPWKQKLLSPLYYESPTMPSPHICTWFSSVQFSSVAQLCLTLCDPMNHSTPGFPVLHNLPEFAQTHIESVSPSNHLILCHPLLLLPSIFPSVRIFPVSQLFTSGGQSIGASASESVLMNIHGWFPLVLTSWSACSPRDSQESSSIPQLESNNGCRNIFLSFKQYLEKCLQKIGFQTQVWISIIWKTGYL